jgi:membrane fusion protein, multidrug efflux system
MKRSILWRQSPLLLAVLAVALSACGGKEVEKKAAVSEKPAVLELASVDVALAQKGSLSGALQVSGALQPVALTTVQSRVAAEINSVAVREGERVQKGQILARLGTQDLDARVKQAEANLASARVEAELSRALDERNQKLFEKKYLSELDYQRSVGETMARNEAMRAQQAMLDIARKALKDASVSSPMNGIVAKRYVEPGSSVGMDGKLFDIVDLSEMELAAPVPATEIAQVKVGQAVTFTVSGFADKKFEGRVLRINPVADAGTRAIMVYVRVSNSGLSLKGGMYARGDIATGAAGEGMTVPLEALHSDANGSWVLVLKDGRLEKRVIDVAGRDERGNRLAVRSGLAEGETVVVAKLTESVINKPARLTQ